MATSAISISLTEVAARTLRQALQQAAGSEVIRLSVDDEFRHRLQLGPAAPSDAVATVDGLAIHVDAASAARCNGSRLDFVPGKEAGFRIDNPNEVPRVSVMKSFELKHRLSIGEPLVLIDSRPPDEREKGQIAGARAFDPETAAYLETLAKDTRLVFYCHWGTRSRKLATEYLVKGFRRVHHLAGGIDEWSLTVDPSIPRYA